MEAYKSFLLNLVIALYMSQLQGNDLCEPFVIVHEHFFARSKYILQVATKERICS